MLDLVRDQHKRAVSTWSDSFMKTFIAPWGRRWHQLDFKCHHPLYTAVRKPCRPCQAFPNCLWLQRALHSSRIYPHAVPNSYDFPSSVELQEDILKNVSAVFVHISETNGVQNFVSSKKKINKLCVINRLKYFHSQTNINIIGPCMPLRLVVWHARTSEVRR